MQDKGNEVLYTFKIKAISRWNSEKTTEYTVYITQGKLLGDDSYGGVVLSIEDTPGSWYVDTLMTFSEPSAITYDMMSIYGNWVCINWQDVMKELKEWVDKPTGFLDNWWVQLPFDALDKIHGIDLTHMLLDVDTDDVLNGLREEWNSFSLEEKLNIYEEYNYLYKEYINEDSLN